MSTIEDRIEWLDIAKGIGIIFVILGHLDTITSSTWKNFGAAFHMPLFFAVAGLILAHRKKMTTLFSYISNRSARLLVPYTLWALIYNNTLNLKALLRIAYGNNKSFGYAGLWFLPVMFASSVISELLIRKIKKERLIFVVIICFILSYGLNVLASVKQSFLTSYGYPFGFDIALSATGFMLIGYTQYDKIKFLADKKKTLLITATLCLLVAFVISRLNYPFVKGTFFDRVVMALALYGNYGLFVIGAIIGTTGILFLSIAIRHSRILEYIGKNSLLYMVINQIAIQLLMKVYSLFPSINIEEIVKSLSGRLALSIASLIFTLLICTVINIVITKFCPVLSGQKA